MTNLLHLRLAWHHCYRSLLLVGLLDTLIFPLALGQSQSPKPSIAGRTSTLLPDGKWLLVGGESASGPAGTAFLAQAETGQETPLPSGLVYPRAWHTATLLPDGTVLVLGGVGEGGRPAPTAELFDPQEQTFTPLQSSPSPRAYHTATLLTDGLVLIAGGVSADGQTRQDAELWNFRTKTSEPVLNSLPTPRSRHSARLLPNGEVFLFGGRDRQGADLSQSERFDPWTRGFRQDLSEGTASAGLLLQQSVPENRAARVPPDAIIGLRFSKPLRVETVNGATVVLTDPEQHPVAAKVVPAEGGMLGFLTPNAPLLPGGTYTVVVDGPTDPAGLPLPFATFSFTTAEDSEGQQPPNDGQSRTGKDAPDLTGPPPLRAGPGVTALAGRVLQVDGRPIPNVLVRMGERRTRTDALGRFLLSSIPSGRRQLIVDGRVTGGPTPFPVFPIAVDVAEGQTTVLSWTIWLPPLDVANAVLLPASASEEVVVTNPRIPGLEVHIPARARLRDIDGNLVRYLSITPIPPNRGPFPGYPGMPPGLGFSLQPSGSQLEPAGEGPLRSGIRVIFPNPARHAPGTRVDLWAYDSRGPGWFVFGRGTVSENGSQILPDPEATLYRLSCGGPGVPVPPASGPPPGGRCGPCAEDGEPVDLATGLFVYRKTDLVLPDVIPIVLTRTHRPADPQRTFGTMRHSYDLFLSGNSTPDRNDFKDLVLADGGIIHYAPNPSGVLEHTSTPTQFYKSTLTSAPPGWLITLKDGTVYEFTLSSNFLAQTQARLSAIRDRYGNRLTIELGFFLRITKITSPNGRFVEFSYMNTFDQQGLITQIRDNTGRTLNYSYSFDPSFGTPYLRQVTDANGGVTEYTYDASGRLATIKDPRQIVYLTIQYDANGRVSQQTLINGGTYLFNYTLDKNSNVTQTQVTDPRNILRTVTFNSSGYVLTDERKVTQQQKQTFTYTRQAGTNFVLSVLDPLNRQTTYTYDGCGNTSSVTRLAGTSGAVTTSYTYQIGATCLSTFNRTKTITEPLNHTTMLDYDAGSSLISITGPPPVSTQTTIGYNTAGQPTSVTTAAGTTQFGYQSGDLTTVTDGLNRTTTRTFDTGGRLVAVTNPLGQTTRYEYNALNALTRITDPLGGQTSFSYDPNGNLLSVTDPRNGVTSYTYNNMDWLESRTDPVQKSESYLYDLAGNLTSFTDRRGQPTTFTYDGFNRLTGASYTGGSSTSYTYDLGNRLTQTVDSISGTINLTYDGLDRLTQEATPQGTVSYTYDAASRRTSMTVTGQPQVTYGYDNANRLSSVTQSGSTVSMGYDGADRRTSLTLPAVPNAVTVNYTYDAADQLTAMIYKLGTTLLGDLMYGYDMNGNRISMGGSFARTTLPQALDYASYDAANRITQWGTITLAYDYDFNGNLLGDGLNSYSWDVHNRLTSHSTPGLNASFQYDPSGKRTSKTVNGVTTLYVYDDENVIQELSGGVPSANLLVGLRMDEVFSRTDSAGFRALLTDGLGSTGALLDSSGVTQTQYTYEPFGKTTASGSSNANSFQFTGRESDGTGLYFYRARYYDPKTARFLNEDPIRFGGGVNFYSYVANNPVNSVDPWGLKVELCCRPVDLPGIVGRVVNVFGDHCFIKTDTKAAGMGPVRDGNLPACPVLTQTKIRDHTADVPISKCKEIPNVDEDCVNRELEIGKYTGRWTGVKNCNTVADDILDKCAKCPPRRIFWRFRYFSNSGNPGCR